MKLLAACALVLGLGACHSKQPLTAPPPPLRPDPEPKVVVPTTVAPKDCEAVVAESQPKPMTFDERSIPEGMKLAEEAKGKLRMADSSEIDHSTKEQYITDAVDELITALRADPYNVTATYNLAAAYAHMNRPQCALNLLQRILQMRQHQSKRADVEAELDHLLGRKQQLDPNFSEMRKDARFRDLISKMCEGTNDANCVFGTQKK